MSSRAAAVAAGGFNAAKTGISVLRGGEGYSSPSGTQSGGGDPGQSGEPSVAPAVSGSAPQPPPMGATPTAVARPVEGGPPAPAQGEGVPPATDRDVLRQQLGDGYVEQGGERGVRAINPYYINDGGVVRGATGSERSTISSMGTARFNEAMSDRSSPTGAAGTSEGAGIQRGREVAADHRAAQRVLGGEGYARASAGNLRSAGGPYVVDHGRTRLATPQERQLMSQLGQSRFNRLFGGAPATRGATHIARPVEQASRQRGPTFDDRTATMQRLGGAGGLASAARNNVRAIGSNYVRDDNGTRLATPAERSAIQTVGQDRFNRVIRNEAGEGGGDITQRQMYFDDRSARRTMGDEAYDRAREGELRSLGGPYMSESGQTRFATPEERRLVDEMGQSRFNRIFGRQPAASAAPATEAQQSGGPGYDEPTGERRSVGSQMREAFRDSYEQHMANARVPLIRDQSGRVVPDSEDGKTARATLGDEEYGAKASRQIRYMGSGAWANVGGRPTPLSADQSHARSVMGNEEFVRSMDRSIRSTGVRDDQGRSLMMDEGQQRVATPAEQRLLDDEGFGEGRFNRMMGERGQYMGEGDFVRDNGTPRLASRNESTLLGQVGEERFNDVMSRRFEEAGTGYRVDAMPTREQVIDQARGDTARIAREVREVSGEAVDRGRDAIQGSGLRAGGLADVGGGVREELRGEERPRAYDAQRAARSERRRGETSSEFFGMKTDME